MNHKKKKEIIRKWRPIVTNNIGVLNEEIMNILHYIVNGI
jgi:hypothetical protein